MAKPLRQQRLVLTLLAALIGYTGLSAGEPGDGAASAPVFFDREASVLQPEALRTTPGPLSGAFGANTERHAPRIAFAAPPETQGSNPVQDRFVLLHPDAQQDGHPFFAGDGRFRAGGIDLDGDGISEVLLERRTASGARSDAWVLELYRAAPAGWRRLMRVRLAGTLPAAEGKTVHWQRRYRFARGADGQTRLVLRAVLPQGPVRPRDELEHLALAIRSMSYAYDPTTNTFALADWRTVPAGSAAPTDTAGDTPGPADALGRMLLDELSLYAKTGQHEAGLVQAEHFREMIANLPLADAAALRIRDGALFWFEGRFFAGLGRTGAARRAWRIAVLNGVAPWSERAAAALRALDAEDGAPPADG